MKDRGVEELPKRPRIVKNLRLYPADKDTLLIRTVGKTIEIAGTNIVELITPVLEQLDGTRIVAEIIANLEKEGYKEKSLLRALKMLHARGLLSDAASEDPGDLSDVEIACYQPQFEFLSLFPEGGYRYQNRLKDSRIVLIGLGPVGAQILSVLCRVGVGRVAGVDAGQVKVEDVTLGSLYQLEDVGQPRCEVASQRVSILNSHVACDFFEIDIEAEQDLAALESLMDDPHIVILAMDAITPLLQEFLWVNSWCVERSLPWVSGGLEDMYHGIVGPMVVPFDTACYHCYQQRFRANLPDKDEFLLYEEYLQQQGRRGQSPIGGVCPFAGIVGNMLALEAIKFLTGFTQPATTNGIIRINLLSMDFRRHHVLKLPRCPTCSRTIDQPLRQVWLDEFSYPDLSQGKRFPAERKEKDGPN